MGALRTPSGSIRRSVAAPIRRLTQVVVRAEDEAAAAPAPAAVMMYDLDELDNAKGAISLGQAMCSEGRWAEGLVIFEKALTLPGTGTKRFRDKPKLLSDGEKCAALFNIACCHSRMNDERSGLVALAGCFEAGYDNYAQVRNDPDLELLRKDERFEVLMARFERKPRTDPLSLFGSMFGNK
ncbi:hypothetical protein FOA52_005963 [Chlamydomonas sp. UWO 241]|nr:hypothetical protein FOA52_005963 [Chlamydomonas sp. UWO 241]